MRGRFQRSDGSYVTIKMDDQTMLKVAMKVIAMVVEIGSSENLYQSDEAQKKMFYAVEEMLDEFDVRYE